jgi:hypothetical protein
MPATSMRRSEATPGAVTTPSPSARANGAQRGMLAARCTAHTNATPRITTWTAVWPCQFGVKNAWRPNSPSATSTANAVAPAQAPITRAADQPTAANAARVPRIGAASQIWRWPGRPRVASMNQSVSYHA